MRYLIESIIDCCEYNGDEDMKNGIYFEKIDHRSDISTSYQFDDRYPNMIKFINIDANGTEWEVNIDLSEYGLTYEYVLSVLKPFYDRRRNFNKKRCVVTVQELKDWQARCKAKEEEELRRETEEE